MLRRQVLVAVLAGVIVTGSTAGAYAAISGGDGPVSSGVHNTGVSPEHQDGPQTVTPQPGSANVRPIAWEKAEVLDDRTVRVLFHSGVEPCYTLDHVAVEYSADQVVITLYQGGDPQAVCIQIAQEKATVVTLSEPLGGRTIVDGSQRR